MKRNFGGENGCQRQPETQALGGRKGVMARRVPRESTGSDMRGAESGETSGTVGAPREGTVAPPAQTVRAALPNGQGPSCEAGPSSRAGPESVPWSWWEEARSMGTSSDAAPGPWEVSSTGPWSISGLHRAATRPSPECARKPIRSAVAPIRRAFFERLVAASLTEAVPAGVGRVRGLTGRPWTAGACVGVTPPAGRKVPGRKQTARGHSRIGADPDEGPE